MFGDDIVDQIVFQTNLYNNWRSHNQGMGAIATVSRKEIIQVIILYMGIAKLPDRHMYWITTTSVAVIAETIS